MSKVLAFLLAALVAVPVQAADFTSPVNRVIDGDTFQLSRPIVKIRLCGVDTPERGQRGYREATNFTKSLVSGKQITCRVVGSGTPCDGRSRKKSYDRFVAQCFVNNRDIGMELVKAGLACAWPKYSGRHYVKNARCVR